VYPAAGLPEAGSLPSLAPFPAAHSQNTHMLIRSLARARSLAPPLWLSPTHAPVDTSRCGVDRGARRPPLILSVSPFIPPHRTRPSSLTGSNRGGRASGRNKPGSIAHQWSSDIVSTRARVRDAAPTRRSRFVAVILSRITYNLSGKGPATPLLLASGAFAPRRGMHISRSTNRNAHTKRVPGINPKNRLE
jgi:hypothetical protein